MKMTRRMRIRQKEKDETTETRIVKKALKLLRKEGGFWIKLHGGPYQQDGLPDIIGCWKGWWISFEVKRPSRKLKATKLQKHILKEISKARGISAIISSAEEALVILHESRKKSK